MKLGGLLAIIFGPISIDTERARPSNVKFTCQIHKEKNTLSAEKSFMCKLRLFRHCSDFCRAQAGNHHLPLKTVGELLQDGLPPSVAVVSFATVITKWDFDDGLS